MIFGVSFYTFLVGSVTSILTAQARDTETLPAKLRQLEDYSQASGLDDDLYYKIRTFLLNNYIELFSKNDEHQLIQELGTSLREEVLYHQFGGLIETVKLLSECNDNDFVWAIVQLA